MSSVLMLTMHTTNMSYVNVIALHQWCTQLPTMHWTRVKVGRHDLPLGTYDVGVLVFNLHIVLHYTMCNGHVATIYGPSGKP
jgi:hypothetical protein